MNWNAMTWVVIAIFVILIGFCITFYYLTPKQDIDVILPETGWRTVSSQGCELFSFTGNFIGNLFQPANPSFNIMGNISSTASFDSSTNCYHIFQLPGNKASQICDNGGCISSTGSYVEKGATRELYINCAGAKLCTGTTNLINISGACLDVSGTNYTFQDCDPTKLEQLFEITRLGSQGNPTPRGMMASIKSLNGGKCLNAVFISENDAILGLDDCQNSLNWNLLGGTVDQGKTFYQQIGVMSNKDAPLLTLDRDGNLLPYSDNPNKATKFVEYQLYNDEMGRNYCPAVDCIPF